MESHNFQIFASLFSENGDSGAAADRLHKGLSGYTGMLRSVVFYFRKCLQLRSYFDLKASISVDENTDA